MSPARLHSALVHTADNSEIRPLTRVLTAVSTVLCPANPLL